MLATQRTRILVEATLPGGHNEEAVVLVYAEVADLRGGSRQIHYFIRWKTLACCSEEAYSWACRFRWFVKELLFHRYLDACWCYSFVFELHPHSSRSYATFCKASLGYWRPLIIFSYSQTSSLYFHFGDWLETRTLEKTRSDKCANHVPFSRTSLILHLMH